MAISPKDLVQRQHNYAIVDEVDSVLIDDARTPLIISARYPKATTSSSSSSVRRLEPGGSTEETKIEKRDTGYLRKGIGRGAARCFSIVKETAKRFSENEEITVTATEFDRHLAATKDFVRMKAIRPSYQNHWVAGGNDTVWNMAHYDVQLFGGVWYCTKARLVKWQPVKVRLWLPPCRYSQCTDRKRCTRGNRERLSGKA